MGKKSKPASFKAEFLVDGRWYDNAIRLATKAEAEAYAVSLFSRWMIPTDKRVVTSDDPPNYTADEHGYITALET
jgi:hypothetical protein